MKQNGAVDEQIRREKWQKNHNREKLQWNKQEGKANRKKNHVKEI